MSSASVGFVKEVAALSPTLTALLEEHETDNFGEMLPHLFVGDVTRHLVALAQASQSEGDLTIRREMKTVLEAMEAGYAAGNPDVQELITASFLENLPSPGEPGSEIRGSLGPRLSRQLREMT